MSVSRTRSAEKSRPGFLGSGPENHPAGNPFFLFLVTIVLIALPTFALAQDTYQGSSFPSPFNYQPVPPAPKPPKTVTTGREAPKPKEGSIRISADHVEQISGKNQVKAWGRVLVVYGTRAIRADRMIINPDTGKGQASGHVVMLAEDGTKIKGTRAQIDIKTKMGRMLDAHGTLGSPDGTKYFVKGKEVRKMGDKHYKVTEASLTTCTGKIPDWLVQVSEADVKTGDRALFKGGVIKIRNMPVGYIPIGYIPLDNERKTGFLTPSFGQSNLDGATLGVPFFWAINDHQDATIDIQYYEKRGVRTSVEYRYLLGQDTGGQFNAVMLDDDVTGDFFWKIDGYHSQDLPGGWSLNGKLDLTSEANFNKTFRNQTENRTRRSSDSWASLFNSWGNNSVDVLARLRQSEEDLRDDTFGLLPQVTWKTQATEIGKTNLYFNQDTTFTTFVTDLDGSVFSDDLVNYQRFDFHPQVNMPITLFPWLQFTPKLGVRETFYSEGFNGQTRLGAINRELIDIQAILEGPKINKVFHSAENKENGTGTKWKHIIEPRFQYDFIPDLDQTDRRQIRVTDSIDGVTKTNRVGYFLTQRLLKKVSSEGGSNTQQMARFEISQSYDFNEADRELASSLDERNPFSLLRFDFDSLWGNWLLLNWDSTLNIYDGTIETFNFDVGVRPTDNLMIIMERRLAHNTSASLLGTIDYTFLPGWNMKFSTRFDEFNETLLEKNGRLTFNDPCQCWGFSLDVIQRLNINSGLRQEETRFLFNFTLRGLGEIQGSQGEQFIHRSF